MNAPTSRRPIGFLACLACLTFACTQATTSEDCSGPNPPGWCTGEGEDSESSEQGEPDACEALASGPRLSEGEDTGGVLQVTNNRAVPIWIPSITEGCMQEPMSMFRADERLFWFQTGSLPAGAWSCDNDLAGDCPGLSCSDTDVPVLRLDPGASRSFVWPSYIHVDARVSAECAAQSECSQGHTCQVGRTLEQGPLQVRLQVSETCEGASCDCDEPHCIVNYGSIDSETFDSVEVLVELAESEGDLEVFIEP